MNVKFNVVCKMRNCWIWVKKGDGIVRGMRGIDLEHIGREAEGIFGGQILFL